MHQLATLNVILLLIFSLLLNVIQYQKIEGYEKSISDYNSIKYDSLQVRRIK